MIFISYKKYIILKYVSLKLFNFYSNLSLKIIIIIKIKIAIHKISNYNYIVDLLL